MPTAGNFLVLIHLEMEDAIERTLCQLPRVYVFRIPTRTSAGGYRAADWPKDPSWTGKLKVIAKGSLLAVVLMDDQNSTFAICNVTDDSCVERTADSGRYFVLKISNAQGRHAFIGIAFDERSDAFDFNVAISTFKTEMEREQRALSTASLTPQEPVDFSLKSGEKIKIKLVRSELYPSIDILGISVIDFCSASRTPRSMLMLVLILPLLRVPVFSPRSLE